MPKIPIFFGWMMLILAALSNVGGSIAMKYFHQTKLDVALEDMAHNPNLKYLAIALLCYASSFIAYVFVVKVIPISIAYPLITGLTILMLLAVARLLLGENLSGSMIIGSAFIIVGVFLIGGPNL